MAQRLLLYQVVSPESLYIDETRGYIPPFFAALAPNPPNGLPVPVGRAPEPHPLPKPMNHQVRIAFIDLPFFGSWLTATSEATSGLRESRSATTTKARWESPAGARREIEVFSVRFVA